MSFKTGLAEAMAQLVRSYGHDCAEVIDWDEKDISDGYCETCYYEWTVVDIVYKDSEGDTKEFQYSGGFGELIRELAP